MKPNMIKRFIFLIIIAASMGLNILSFDKGHNWGGDFSQYIMQAASIVNDKVPDVLEKSQYRNQRSSMKIGPDLYSWGFPLLLAPAYAVFGFNIYLLKIYLLFFFALSLIILYFLFKDNLLSFQLLMIISFFAFSPFFLLHNNQILSDIPFFFFSLFTIYLIQKFIIFKDIWINEVFSSFLIGFLIFISFSIRSVGILILPALFCCHFMEGIKAKNDLRRRPSRSTIVVSIPYFTFMMFYLLNYLAFESSGSSSYSTYFNVRNIGERVYFNIVYYSNLPIEFFRSIYISDFAEILFGMTIPFFTFGMVAYGRKYYLYIVYSAIMLFILIIYPWLQGLRFLFPILPFYFFFTFKGMSYTFDLISKNFLSKIVYHGFMIGIALSFLVSCLQVSYLNITKNDKILDGPYKKESVEMFEFIKQETPQEAVIIFFKPRVMTLFTSRNAIMLNNLEQLLQRKGDYLVYSHLQNESSIKDQISLNQKIHHYFMDNFQLVFHNSDFTIWKLTYQH